MFTYMALFKFFVNVIVTSRSFNPVSPIYVPQRMFSDLRTLYLWIVLQVCYTLDVRFAYIVFMD